MTECRDCGHYSMSHSDTGCQAGYCECVRMRP